MNLLHIKKISEKKGVSIRKLAESIGMSEQNLHRCIRVNQIQAHQLEQIAHLLEVPVVCFFDEEVVCENNKIGKVSGTGNRVQQGHVNVMLESQEREIENLKLLLTEKDKVISEKERLIQILMKGK
jgi:hypothetical protein|nr:MAG TPA: LAMBDA REPRESSOR (TRIPLE MUTANT)/DNA COMPLEX-DNA COMPLEX, DOUBLE HELIX, TRANSCRIPTION-DNA.1A [Caudoviricetes sp.]